MDLMERIELLQNDVLKMVDDPTYQPAGLTFGLSALLQSAFDRHNVPLSTFDLRSGVAISIYKPEALAELTQLIDKRVEEHGGKRDFTERRKAVEGTVRSLLVAASYASTASGIGDLLIMTRVMPRISKGAMLLAHRPDGQSVYHNLKELNEVPFFDARILPYNALADIVRFMLDNNNLITTDS